MLNGAAPTEYKLNNVPVKLFSWDEPQKQPPPAEEKPFKVVQQSEANF
jgi:hypothetical protein